MSHFLIVPINENGVIDDENIGTELTLGCSSRFGITDVFCYSHGWWTTVTRAVAQYNRFSIEFVDRTLEIVAKEPPILSRPPTVSGHRPALAVHAQRGQRFADQLWRDRFVLHHGEASGCHR